MFVEIHHAHMHNIHSIYTARIHTKLETKLLLHKLHTKQAFKFKTLIFRKLNFQYFGGALDKAVESIQPISNEFFSLQLSLTRKLDQNPDFA